MDKICPKCNVIYRPSWGHSCPAGGSVAPEGFGPRKDQRELWLECIDCGMAYPEALGHKCDLSGKMTPSKDAKPEPETDKPMTAEEVCDRIRQRLKDVEKLRHQFHYARYKIQPVVFIAENNLDFLTGNIIKYVLRHDAKDGVKDLEKAKHYLDMLIQKTRGETVQP